MTQKFKEQSDLLESAMDRFDVVRSSVYRRVPDFRKHMQHEAAIELGDARKGKPFFPFDESPRKERSPAKVVKENPCFDASGAKAVKGTPITIAWVGKFYPPRQTTSP